MTEESLFTLSDTSSSTAAVPLNPRLPSDLGAAQIFKAELGWQLT